MTLAICSIRSCSQSDRYGVSDPMLDKVSLETPTKPSLFKSKTSLSLLGKRSCPVLDLLERLEDTDAAAGILEMYWRLRC